jgi:hypothetical protein
MINEVEAGINDLNSRPIKIKIILAKFMESTGKQDHMHTSL